MAAYKKISILINPFAGNCCGAALYRRIKKALGKHSDLKSAVASICLTEKNWNGDWCRKAVSDTDLVVICGGDGTVHQAVNALKRLSYKGSISLFPLGTGNDLYRTLNFKKMDIIPFLRKVMNNPHSVNVDLFRLNGKIYFTNFVGYGFDGKVVYFYEKVVERYKDTLLFKIPYVKMALWVMLGFPLFFCCGKSVRLKEDGRRYFNIVISSIKTYAGGAIFADDTSPTDGIIENVFFHTKFHYFKFMLNRAAFGVMLFDLGASGFSLPARLSYEESVSVQLDGEDYTNFFTGSTDFDISHVGKITVCG